MIINNNEIVIKSIQEEDIPLFDKWLDKEYIKKWFGEKEDWLNEINERNGQYSFLKHFIVYYNDRKIGYCLYADCFFLKYLEEEGHDFQEMYGDVAEQNHTYEIGYLIGEEEFLNRGIGKRIIQILEDRIIKIGGKEIAADPAEENIISIKALLSNGFKKKKRRRLQEDLQNAVKMISTVNYRGNRSILTLYYGYIWQERRPQPYLPPHLS